MWWSVKGVRESEEAIGSINDGVTTYLKEDYGREEGYPYISNEGGIDNPYIYVCVCITIQMSFELNFEKLQNKVN